MGTITEILKAVSDFRCSIFDCRFKSSILNLKSAIILFILLSLIPLVSTGQLKVGNDFPDTGPGPDVYSYEAKRFLASISDAQISYFW